MSASKGKRRRSDSSSSSSSSESDSSESSNVYKKNKHASDSDSELSDSSNKHIPKVKISSSKENCKEKYEKKKSNSERNDDARSHNRKQDVIREGDSKKKQGEKLDRHSEKNDRHSERNDRHTEKNDQHNEKSDKYAENVDRHRRNDEDRHRKNDDDRQGKNVDERTYRGADENRYHRRDNDDNVGRYRRNDDGRANERRDHYRGERQRRDERESDYSKERRRSPGRDRRDYRNERRNRSRSKSFDHSNARWGKGDGPKSKQDTKHTGDKQKPNFGLSGKLTEETNTFRGVVVKYSEPPEARKAKRRWRLYPFKGEKALQTLYIHRESAYLIGRERKVVDLAVDHPSCSKQHAALQYRLVPFTREDGSSGKRVRPYLIDLDSANGTFINNKKIDPRKYVELFEKDVIKFGFSSREYVLLHENSKDETQDDDVKLEDELEVKVEVENNT